MLTRALAASLIVLTVGCSGATSSATNYPAAWSDLKASEQETYCTAAQTEGVLEAVEQEVAQGRALVASAKPELVAQYKEFTKQQFGGSIEGFAAYATEQCKTWAPPTEAEALQEDWDATNPDTKAEFCAAFVRDGAEEYLDGSGIGDYSLEGSIAMLAKNCLP